LIKLKLKENILYYIPISSLEFLKKESPKFKKKRSKQGSFACQDKAMKLFIEVGNFTNKAQFLM